MSEDKKEKKEVQHVDYDNPYDRAESITTYTGLGRGADVRHAVYWPCPQISADKSCEEVEAELQEFFGIGLNEMIQAGVRQMSTRVNYQGFFNVDGEFDSAGAQKAVEDYKVGNRAAAPGMKALKETMKESGMSATDLMALIAKAKELGLNE